MVQFTNLFALTASCSAFASLAFAWPEPEPINGTIPNHATNSTLDPGLIRRSSDGKLFLYVTEKQVWTADSLYGPWSLEPISAFGNGTSADDEEHAGAPQLYEFDGLYYMYYSNSFNYTTIGYTDPLADTQYYDASQNVRTSTTAEPGSWTPFGRLNVTWNAHVYNILDGSVMNAGNDTNPEYLLSFGSFVDGLYQVPLADPPVELAEYGNDNITHLAYNGTANGRGATDPSEASFQFQWGGYYYLFFSDGECCYSAAGFSGWASAGEVYKIMVCRSEDPRGGYVDQDGNDCLTESGGTMVLGSHGTVWAPGGQGVMNDTEVGGPIIYYHYVPFNTTTNEQESGYLFGWNKLDFSTGWPVVTS